MSSSFEGNIHLIQSKDSVFIDVVSTLCLVTSLIISDIRPKFSKIYMKDDVIRVR